MHSDVVATGLRKRYGDTVALADVSLDVQSGEVYALIGPNGAGKTTLVRSLTGTTEPDAGSASLLGTDPMAVDRDRIGVLPQSFSPPDRLTARELLDYYAGLYESARDPERVLADVGLSDAGDTWYEKLSGGQQRRLCVGSTLVNDPAVCFLDEPTTGIDPAGRRTVWQLIEDLAGGGTTVVLTTHDMAEAEHLADRVGLLADGELIAEGSPDELVADHGGESRLVVDLAVTPEAEGDSDGRVGSPRPSDASGVLPDAAFDDLPFEVDVGDRSAVVRDVEPTDIGRVVDALDDRAVPYSGLSWREPDLEDVYLSLARGVEDERTRRDQPDGSLGDRSVATGGAGR